MSARITDASNFLDLHGLNDIKLLSKSTDPKDKKAALGEVAKQFESLFTQMLLKSMRKAQDVLASDSPFNSQSVKFYRDMHDQQLALELSNNGSLGLAPLIVRQLGGGDENYKPSSVLRNDATLNGTKKSPHAYDLKRITNIINQPKIATVSSEDNNSSSSIKQNYFISTPSFSQPKDFVNALIEPAKQVEQKLGVPFAVVIAQAALETGWGQKIIKTAQGQSSNNLFNIKADDRWQGDKTTKETLEFQQGAMVKVKAPFRVYQSINDSVNDFVDFLSTNDRYQEALNKVNDVEQFLHGLETAGYATDPNYANKILSTLGRVTDLLKD
ncbi:MAG: flagellar assembly peptidoglycan hydrolase FlgJ [Alteromonadaceae bacterium]|nr:flagellar assembly peptidoglycan hydrolase FlgJ [Alteromonadaceae bacterium]